MNRELKNFRAAERWIVKKLRAWLDRIDDGLHHWEVAIREPLKPPVMAGYQVPVPSTESSTIIVTDPTDPCFYQSHRATSTRARSPRVKRRMTAAEFDLDIRNRVMARAGAL